MVTSNVVHSPFKGISHAIPQDMKQSKSLNVPNSRYANRFVWTSPFEDVTSSLGETDTIGLTSAITAAAHAESHVRRGINAANQLLPSLTQVIKHYFAVSHISVWYKIFAFFFPPFGYRKVWSNNQLIFSCDLASVCDETKNDSCGYQNIYHLLPDLYIPLMAFTTYVLLCGLTQGALQEFHPQIFSSTASFALILIILELAICVFGFYLIGAQHLPILDVLSILGLKFEGSVVIVIMGLLFRHIRYVFWFVALYCSLCASNSSFQWIKKCEKCNQTHLEWKSSKMNTTLFHYFTIVISVAQALFIWLLIPSLLKKTPKI